MTELWTTLIPLAVATAVLPIQVAITILMLRSAGGRAKAGAWIAGMTLVRLVQYAVFGLILERAMDDVATGTSPVEGALLLVVAVLLHGLRPLARSRASPTRTPHRRAG